MRPHVQTLPLAQQIRNIATERVRDCQVHRREMADMQMGMRNLQMQVAALLTSPPPPCADDALPALPPPSPPAAASAASAASSITTPLQEEEDVAIDATAASLPPTPPLDSTASPLDSPAQNTRSATRHAHIRQALEELRTSGYSMGTPHCPICLRPWAVVGMRVSPACGHHMCGACCYEDEWQLCPICRKPTRDLQYWSWEEMRGGEWE